MPDIPLGTRVEYRGMTGPKEGVVVGHYQRFVLVVSEPSPQPHVVPAASCKVLTRG